MTVDGERIVLLAQMASTLFMVGLIWFVQAVHYPLLAQVGTDRFVNYEATHVRLTSWVVGPPMLIEALTTLILIVWTPAGVSPTMCWIGFALLLVIWASTAVLQVPRHNVLANGFDPAAHQGLVLSNWVRTVSWTFRGLLVLLMADQGIAGTRNGIT
ncbi:MAG: hypothetical protein K2R98_18865 [Gemmataceae bacterium]|nr:hypothetical protein [Gemmataceae bacterium]